MTSIIKQSGKGIAYLTEFIADALSDIISLPHLKDDVAAGSTCFVIENSTVYMLGNDDIWHEI